MVKVKADKTVVELVTLLEEERIQKEIEEVHSEIKNLETKLKPLNKELESTSESEQKLFVEKTIEKLKSQKQFFCELNGLPEEEFEVIFDFDEHSSKWTPNESVKFSLTKNRKSSDSTFYCGFNNLEMLVLFQSEKIESIKKQVNSIVQEKNELWNKIYELNDKKSKLDRFSKQVQLSLKVEELSKTPDGKKKLAQAKEILANKDGLVENIQKKLGE